MHGYNGKIPLKILGSFEARIKAEGRETSAHFRVAEGHGGNLLSFATARRLDLFNLSMFAARRDIPTSKEPDGVRLVVDSHLPNTPIHQKNLWFEEHAAWRSVVQSKGGGGEVCSEPQSPVLEVIHSRPAGEHISGVTVERLKQPFKYRRLIRQEEPNTAYMRRESTCVTTQPQILEGQLKTLFFH